MIRRWLRPVVVLIVLGVGLWLINNGAMPSGFRGDIIGWIAVLAALVLIVS